MSCICSWGGICIARGLRVEGEPRQMPCGLAQAPVLADLSSGLEQLHGPCRQLGPDFG